MTVEKNIMRHIFLAFLKLKLCHFHCKLFPYLSSSLSFFLHYFKSTVRNLQCQICLITGGDLYKTEGKWVLILLLFSCSVATSARPGLQDDYQARKPTEFLPKCGQNYRTLGWMPGTVFVTSRLRQGMTLEGTVLILASPKCHT